MSWGFQDTIKLWKGVDWDETIRSEKKKVGKKNQTNKQKIHIKVIYSEELDLIVSCPQSLLYMPMAS